MAVRKLDNGSFDQKVALRRAVLARVKNPVVMETHGGKGKLWRACYADVPAGVVFEKNPLKADVLSSQRPTWAVYEADCVKALAAGAGAHLEINLLDLDPYGEPWPAITAFLESERPRANELWIVVNDGMRLSLKMQGADKIASLWPALEKFGGRIFDRYLDVCQFLLTEKAVRAGYRLNRFTGNYGGHNQQMTHYAAMLTREGSAGG